MALPVGLTNHAVNAIGDNLLRGQSNALPGALYIAMIVATRGSSDTIRSVNVSPGDTVIPATPNGHIYKCTTGGLTGSGEPSWTTASGSTVADGAAVWTEQTPNLENGIITECQGAGYARELYNSTLANWSGTQGPGTTTPSTGTSGTFSNNNTITLPTPGTSGANWGLLFGHMLFDALTAGNAWLFGALDTPKNVNIGDPAPAYSATTLSFVLTRTVP